MKRGSFIAVEGIDGSGTSTQARALADALAARGRKAWLTAEPTEGEIGRLLRRYLSGALPLSGSGPEDRRQLALLFAADRQDHLASRPDGILARLERGEDVVCARYVLSSYAYEGDDPAELEFVRTLNAAFPAPDLTLYLDCPVEVSLARLSATRDALDIFENRTELERVREGYRRALSADEGPVLVCDATRPAGEITHDALAVLGLGGR
ncbi:MAG: dTMP kinase [Planctomycetota bacterium]